MILMVDSQVGEISSLYLEGQVAYVITNDEKNETTPLNFIDVEGMFVRYI